GRIEKVRLTGDFFGTSPVGEVEAALAGIPYEREAVALALPETLLERTLWNVPRETLLEVLFDR
ncbi:MAG: lipoate--protein ligase, partial [Clostridia bacterium]|nr:lipoate--protein ligase [Clostridia bacterium]